MRRPWASQGTKKKFDIRRLFQLGCVLKHQEEGPVEGMTVIKMDNRHATFASPAAVARFATVTHDCKLPYPESLTSNKTHVQ